MISKSFMPSVLMMAISTVMLGCGGGSSSGGDSSSSNGGGTDNPDNGNTIPKPVTCVESQMGQCQDPLLLRVKWLDDKTFILIEKVQINNISPPRTYLYRVKSYKKNGVDLTDIWTGWGDYKDTSVSYYYK